jgi:hypothetical protein
MPRQHTEATKEKMSAATRSNWADPLVRAARIDGYRTYNASRRPGAVVIRQDGRDVLLAVTSWEERIPVVDLAEQPDSLLLLN